MSEENKKEEVTELKQKVIKLSELLRDQDQATREPESKCVHNLIEEQIRNNQELYTTLSRSLLELHNDIREFRHKTESLERVIFSLQQGINKGLLDTAAKINDIEKELEAVKEAFALETPIEEL